MPKMNVTFWSYWLLHGMENTKHKGINNHDIDDAAAKLPPKLVNTHVHLFQFFVQHSFISPV